MRSQTVGACLCGNCSVWYEPWAVWYGVVLGSLVLIETRASRGQTQKYRPGRRPGCPLLVSSRDLSRKTAAGDARPDRQRLESGVRLSRLGIVKEQRRRSQEARLCEQLNGNGNTQQKGTQWRPLITESTYGLHVVWGPTVSPRGERLSCPLLARSNPTVGLVGLWGNLSVLKQFKNRKGLGLGHGADYPACQCRHFFV